MAYTLLQMCKGPEKHISITAEVEIISEYGKTHHRREEIAENKR